MQQVCSHLADILVGRAKMDAELQRKSAELMRVNHVGEVCAQALYQGQALTSRSAAIRAKMVARWATRICYDG